MMGWSDAARDEAEDRYDPEIDSFLIAASPKVFYSSYYTTASCQQVLLVT